MGVFFSVYLYRTILKQYGKNRKTTFIREEMRIPDVTNMDGLVSLMGRSMDNEESFHIDLLLASLSRMHPFVKQEDVERMVPVFEMARTVVEGEKTGQENWDVRGSVFSS